MARFLPIDITANNTALVPSISPVTGAKIFYDQSKCFPTKVVYDVPGTYTFSMPSTATCAKIAIVGGGGKPLFTANACCSYGGAGGSYSEKFFSGPGGATFTVVVGAPQGTTSISCNGVSSFSAGGATCCTPGVATGGDFNSTGGDPGMTMQYGGSNNGGCGACVCIATCNVCGYCFVIAYKDSPNSDGNSCCMTLLAGGGSAGSPFKAKGGNGWCVCGNCWSGVAGGGGGIGQCNCLPWYFVCCSCLCYQTDGNTGPNNQNWGTNYPTSAAGGGGSQAGCVCYADGFPSSFSGICQWFIHQGGHGGGGGPLACDGQPMRFGYSSWARSNPSYGGCCCMSSASICRYQNDPVRVDWWDTSEICGSGAPGYVAENSCTCNTYLGSGWYANRPSNSGEGAGTGGIMNRWCQIMYHAWGIPNTSAVTNMINFPLLCYLGTSCQCNLAPKLVDKLIPFHFTCAGTLGGSGGVSWCGYDSKAGFGGGGGQVKWSIVCVCNGGAYDCCNQVAATPLAFPPACLDWMVSNAGSGLAIIYYRED